jgi:hypothetical protein
MSSVAELSEAGYPADLEAVLVAVDTPRQFLPDPWDQEASMDHPADLVALEVVDSEEVSTVEEDEADSEVASRNGVAMAAEEVVLATKAAEAFHEEDKAVTVVRMEVPMDIARHPMRLLDQEAEEAVLEEAVMAAEEGMVAPVPLIAMDLAAQHQLVGMTRVVAVAHMMTGPADIVAVEDTTIGTELVVVVATWSR